MAKGWMSDDDKRYLNDMKKEMMKESLTREDPALKPITCKCGHRLAHHYMGDRAMACGKCSCNWCTAPRAEEIRRDKYRTGAPEMHPHPTFRKGKG
jgi:hypothetical protein